MKPFLFRLFLFSDKTSNEISTNNTGVNVNYVICSEILKLLKKIAGENCDTKVKSENELFEGNKYF